jgi:hypothetical protein
MTKPSAKLKPCPFQHKHTKPFEKVCQYPLGRYYVRCSFCLAHGPAADTEWDAVAAWNRRAGTRRGK